jgi:cell division transport system permease protein
MPENEKSKVANSTSLTAIFLMVFSGALLLFLLGIYLVVALHSENIVAYLKEHTAIVFEIDGENKALVAEIKGDERLRPESITYVTKEEGLAFMQEEMGGQILPEDMSNPFSDLITSFVRAEFTAESELEKLRADWRGKNGILDVYFQNDYLTFWDVWKRRLFAVTAAAAAVLLVITVMLIFNTVKLTVFMKKRSIEILELVGASWSFIRAPFIRVAIKMGLVSALLASVMIALALSVLVWKVPYLREYFNWYFMVTTIVVLILIGVFMQLVSTHVVLQRMLKATVSHLKS